MSSDRRKTASRKNGALSRGPVTEAGKARSAMNALRHGILSNNILAAAEKTENFKALYDQHIERFGPLDGVEFGMLESMLSSYWRMHRVWAIEKTWLDQEVAALPKTNEMLRQAVGYANLSQTDKHKLIGRYENRMHRMYRMSLDTLVKLQKTRPEDVVEIESGRPAQMGLFDAPEPDQPSSPLANPGPAGPAPTASPAGPDSAPAAESTRPADPAPIPPLAPESAPAATAAPETGSPADQTNLIPFPNTIEGKLEPISEPPREILPPQAAPVSPSATPAIARPEPVAPAESSETTPPRIAPSGHRHRHTHPDRTISRTPHAQPVLTHSRKRVATIGGIPASTHSAPGCEPPHLSSPSRVQYRPHHATDSAPGEQLT